MTTLRNVSFSSTWEHGKTQLIFAIAAYADSQAVGSWYIPFSGDNSSLATVSKYVACSGVHQRAVTHSDARTPLTAVPLQWTPPHTFHGTVIITATIVTNYTHYWTNLQSLPVSVRSVVRA